MLMDAGPEEETCGSRAAEDKGALSLSVFLSLPPFHADISTFSTFFPPLNNLPDFGMKGSECLVDGKGEEGCSCCDLHHL